MQDDGTRRRIRLRNLPRAGLLVVCFACGGGGILPVAAGAQEALVGVGFAHRDVTPKKEHVSWLAGYGHGRRATGVHDRLFARCVALGDAQQKIALVSVDLIGLQYPAVRRIRAELTEFAYVLVASTHNHEAPDVIGMWGPTPLHRGVDEGYHDLVVQQIVDAVRAAANDMRPAVATFGTAEDASLVTDYRRPYIKDGVIRTLTFQEPKSGARLGLLVQWSCHPETLGARNTLITADFPGATIAALEAAYACPVIYFSGALGGFMGPPENGMLDDRGRSVGAGQFEFAHAYGAAVAKLAEEAIDSAAAVKLAPLKVVNQVIEIPIENPLYRLARTIGIVRRKGRVWTGDYRKLGPPIESGNVDQPHGTITEVGCIRLGDVCFAAIPGEIYPELVYGGVEDPPQAGADFPEAAAELPISAALPSERFFVLGLANDEIGYILPRRQWDLAPPFAYGRSTSQYGEIHSSSSFAGPIITAAFTECARQALAGVQTRSASK